MIKRKDKIRLIQFLLLFIGTLIVFFTYFNKEKPQEKIISSIDKENIKKTENESSDQLDYFYNIKYSGLDLQGNRYVLKSKEAQVNKNLQEIYKFPIVFLHKE